jgi:hypothetical protein
VIVYGPPVFLLVSLVVIFVDKHCSMARKGLLVSILTFIVWLIFIIGGWFGKIL